jgi:hypothetical protein
LPTVPTLSGFLLRSELVADFPDLVIDGYAREDAPPLNASDRPDARKLRILRQEKLSDAVLLVLFDGALDTLDLHLAPQALHFEGRANNKERLDRLLGELDHQIPPAEAFDAYLAAQKTFSENVSREFAKALGGEPVTYPSSVMSQLSGIQEILDAMVEASIQYPQHLARINDLRAKTDELQTALLDIFQGLSDRAADIPKHAPESGAVSKFVKEHLALTPLVRFIREGSV